VLSRVVERGRTVRAASEGDHDLVKIAGTSDAGSEQQSREVVVTHSNTLGWLISFRYHHTAILGP
jgi:hypothetical protein